MILIKILIFDKLILMDDVSGLADKSEDFVNCLTMSQKFNFTFIYVSHTMYPTRYNWHMILSQKKIFNIFPGVLTNVLSEKFCLLTVTGTLTNTFPTETFG